jgi:hypothetical protein
MCHISRKVSTHFCSFHISDIGRLCNAPEVWSGHIHVNTGNSTHTGGVGHWWSFSCSLTHVAAVNSPDATPTKGSSVAKVHMDTDATHLKKSNHSFSHFLNLGSRPTVQCVRDVVGPHPCEHWQLYSHWRGWSPVVFQLRWSTGVFSCSHIHQQCEENALTSTSSAGRTL